MIKKIIVCALVFSIVALLFFYHTPKSIVAYNTNNLMKMKNIENQITKIIQKKLN